MSDPDDSPGEPEAASPAPSPFSIWAHSLTGFLGAAGTVVGIYATIVSHAASDQATKNAQALNEFKVKLQAANTFAAGIHEARDALALQAPASGGIPAMVEVSRLYAVATTPQQKLVLIQIAQLSKQQAALLALSTLVANDEELRRDADAPTLAAIDRIVRKATIQLADAPKSRPPTTPVPKGAKPPAGTTKVVAPPDDPSLTASSDQKTAANASLVASLPKAQGEHGWIFAGDVDDWGDKSKFDNLPLIPYTSTISSKIGPKLKVTFTACRDLNIRTVPFAGGSLGAIAGIASQGTVFTADSPPRDPPVASSFSTLDHATGRHVTARWVYVAIAPSLPEAANGGATPAGTPTASPCTAAEMPAPRAAR